MKKIFVPLISVIALSSCAGLFNGVKEFGDARVTADYFLKDYSDFFYYADKDYVCVAHASSSVKRGEYVSAINGKKGNSYRFFTFGNYEEKEYLVVNRYNKIRKIDEDYFYASKDAPSIPLEFIFFPYEIQDRELVLIDNLIDKKAYMYYDDSFQIIEKGEEVRANNKKLYNFVKDHPDWIMRTEEEVTKLYFYVNMPTFDVDMAWYAKDITVK